MKAKTLLLALLMTATLTAAALGAGFEAVKDYEEGTFTDIIENEWYAKEVESSYRLGLMNGTSDRIFYPEGNVTIAEAITMAARANAIYFDREIEQADGQWYDMYVNYGIEHGFVSPETYTSCDEFATRSEVADFFARAMGKEYFTEKNKVNIIPDVKKDNICYDSILTLYKAGVVMGSDKYGTFHPDAFITRAEAAAIINRVALPNNRLEKTLERRIDDGAYQLAGHSTFDGIRGVASGFTHYNGGGFPRTGVSGSFGSLTDISETDNVVLTREFNSITTGIVTIETSLTLVNRKDGVYLEYKDEKENILTEIQFFDGAWHSLKPDGGYQKLYDRVNEETAFSFVIDTDLDAGVYTVSINNKACGTFDLLRENAVLGSFCYGTSVYGTASVKVNALNAYVNYGIREDAVQSVNGGETLEKTFTAVGNNPVFEVEFILDKGQSTDIILKNEENSAAKFSTDNKSFYFNGEKIYDYVQNLWYRLRIETDHASGMTTVKLNGRSIFETYTGYALNVLDGYSVKNHGSDAVKIDNLSAFSNPTYDDYVPVPVKPKGEEKHTVGMNACSLWENGTHYGWSVITPYERPVLGYYDEGSPETADWEIKYLVEHGVDFQAFCWFPDKANAPLKDLPNSKHLHNGFMNAKYSELSKYCLLYEAKNSVLPAGIEAWKEYWVPYMIENYFKDPRYMTIDNNPIFAVFSPGSLHDAKAFGSKEGCKQAFDYLEEEVKKLGFDGMLYLSTDSSNAHLADMGFDGSIAYSWGREGYKISRNREGILASAGDDNVYTIPTVSVGFNDIAWYGEKAYPLMTVTDYEATHHWVKETYLPEYSEEGTWKENFVWLSTWNEFGEGTYIMPCENNGGFGYLDVIRKLYTDEMPDESLNTVPTEAQLERINHLYPQDLAIMRKEGAYDPAKDTSNLKSAMLLDMSRESLGVPTLMKEYTVTEDGVSGVTDADNRINFTGLPAIDLSQVMSVKITAKVPSGNRQEIFFTTAESPAWDQNKSASIQSDSDEMKEYIIDVSKNKNWKGTLREFRYDPAWGADVPFAVKSIELFSKIREIPEYITINGSKVKMDVPAAYFDDGTLLVAFDPMIALDYRLNASYLWNKDTGKIDISVNGHKLSYQIGSMSFSVDGEALFLNYPLKSGDGLPMLPIVDFCNYAGYTVTQAADGSVEIVTEQEELVTLLNAETPGNWSFDIPDRIGNWISPHFNLSSEGGYLSAKTIADTKDPVMRNVSDRLSAEKFKEIKVRVRYQYDSETPHYFVIYFITDKDTAWNEDKTFKCVLRSTDTKGEWEEYSFMTSDNKLWKDTVIQLRIDPFNTTGFMDFDYITFVEDENYIDPKDRPFEVPNGNAETNDTIPFRSENADFEIVKDPQKSSNKCFLVTSKGGKNTYVYARVGANLRPDQTYQIDYDLKMASLDSNFDIDKSIPAVINCNIRYSDPGNKTDHVIGTKKLTVADGWVHCSFKVTVNANSEDRSSDEFAIYSNPVDGMGVGYYLDNIVVKEVEE